LIANAPTPNPANNTELGVWITRVANHEPIADLECLKKKGAD